MFHDPGVGDRVFLSIVHVPPAGAGTSYLRTMWPTLTQNCNSQGVEQTVKFLLRLQLQFYSIAIATRSLGSQRAAAATSKNLTRTLFYGLDVTVTLGRILNFFTGAEEIPPEGFNHPPVLTFNPDEVFPTSSTCAVELVLPTYTQYSEDYERFKQMLDMGFICHGGFGKH